MTKEDLAKAYYERIIEQNPQAEALNFSGAFIDGYTEGFADASKIERVPSDDMIIKIINLYNSFGVDKVDENFKILSVETIKQHLYEK